MRNGTTRISTRLFIAGVATFMLLSLSSQVARAQNTDPSFTFGPNALVDGPRGTVMAPAGTNFSIGIDFKGMTFRRCTVVLTGARWKHGTYGLDAVWPYDNACPASALTFPIEGKVNSVEMVFAEGRVEFIDPADQTQTVQVKSIRGLLEVATIYGFFQ